jgi:hypothetical protein
VPNAQVDVDGGAPNPESYTNNGDGTVTDHVIGLVWQQVVPTQTYDQGAALSYCSCLALGRWGDWRLPSVIELVSLVDLGTANPSINAAYFPNAPAQSFWSSTAAVSFSAGAWIVNFGDGTTALRPRTDFFKVRCVHRGGEP